MLDCNYSYFAGCSTLNEFNLFCRRCLYTYVIFLNLSLKFWTRKNGMQAILGRPFCFFFKYFFFYILIISNYFRKDKLFILIVVPLYKNFPKTVILRGHVFVFLHIILQLSLRFIAHLK